MNRESIAELLEKLRTDPETVRQIRARVFPAARNELAQAYADAARAAGAEVTKEEILSFISETESQVGARSDAATASVRELPEEELSRVAGGGDHPECYDTFKDKENCWIKDGCDHIYQDYKKYVCKGEFHNKHCGDMEVCGYMHVET